MRKIYVWLFAACLLAVSGTAHAQAVMHSFSPDEITLTDDCGTEIFPAPISLSPADYYSYVERAKPQPIAIATPDGKLVIKSDRGFETLEEAGTEKALTPATQVASPHDTSETHVYSSEHAHISTNLQFLDYCGQSTQGECDSTSYRGALLFHDAAGVAKYSIFALGGC